MRYVIAITMLLFCVSAVGADQSIQLNGLSHHFVDAKGYDFREFNYGLGYTREFDVGESYVGETHQQISVGYYRNSFDNDTFYAAYGRAWQLTDDLSVSLNVSVMTGYEDRFRHNVGELTPVVFPALEYKRVRMTITPQVVAMSFNIIEW